MNAAFFAFGVLFEEGQRISLRVGCKHHLIRVARPVFEHFFAFSVFDGKGVWWARLWNAVGQWSGSVARTVFFDEFGKVLLFDIFELFARLFHIFEGFHDGLGHLFVGFLGTADD